MMEGSWAGFLLVTNGSGYGFGCWSGSPTQLFYCQSSVSRNFFGKIFANSPRIFCGYNSTLTVKSLSTATLLFACLPLDQQWDRKQKSFKSRIDTGFLWKLLIQRIPMLNGKKRCTAVDIFTVDVKGFAVQTVDFEHILILVNTYLFCLVKSLW
jgi:hypothetical protein